MEGSREDGDEGEGEDGVIPFPAFTCLMAFLSLGRGAISAASSRPSPVSLQEPDPSPSTWLGTRSCGKMFLAQRRRNARAPPRGQPRSLRHQPRTMELLQPRLGQKLGGGEGESSSWSLRDVACGTSDFSETPPSPHQRTLSRAQEGPEIFILVTH